MTVSLEAFPAAQVVVRRSGGQGIFHARDGDHPLGALTYFVSSAGRGGLALQAGSGEVKLSGADADQTGRQSWRLKIDVVQIVSVRRAQATCDLQLAAGEVYRSLDCRGVIEPQHEPFSLRWRGDGHPAQAVRPSGLDPLWPRLRFWRPRRSTGSGATVIPGREERERTSPPVKLTMPEGAFLRHVSRAPCPAARQ